MYRSARGCRILFIGDDNLISQVSSEIGAPRSSAKVVSYGGQPAADSWIPLTSRLGVGRWAFGVFCHSYTFEVGCWTLSVYF